MKEQEVQDDAQAGMQFMGSSASPPASPLLTGDTKSSSAGEPQLLRGSEPRQCTKPYAPRQLFAQLDVQLWLGTPGQAVWGGWLSQRGSEDGPGQ